MPIEIKELVIRTVVGSSTESESGGRDRTTPSASLPGTGGTEEIIQECVRQVLRVLARDRER